MNLLAHRNADKRVAAIDVLAEIDDKRALPVMLRALRDRSWKVRMRAAELVAPLLSGKRVPDQFIRLIRDPHELVRVQAVESLADVGDTRIIRHLKRSLNDRSPLVRSYAAATIGTLGTTKDRQFLARRLKRERNETAQLGLLAALYTPGDDHVLNRLIGLLESSDFEVRNGSAATLVRSIADRRNAEQIRSALKIALRREKSINTRYYLRRLLKELTSKFPPTTKR